MLLGEKLLKGKKQEEEERKERERGGREMEEHETRPTGAALYLDIGVILMCVAAAVRNAR